MSVLSAEADQSICVLQFRHMVGLEAQSLPVIPNGSDRASLILRSKELSQHDVLRSFWSDGSFVRDHLEDGGPYASHDRAALEELTSNGNKLIPSILINNNNVSRI